MACTNTLLRACMALLCFVASSSFGSYVITVPKKWIPGGDLQVCVLVNNADALQGKITISIENGILDAGQQNMDNNQLVQESIQVPQGNQHLCTSITLPHMAQDSMLHQERSDIMHINGTLDGLPVSHIRALGRQTFRRKMIAQTDRSQYKPGQTVHFRVLSHTGPFMEISTENYHEIYITTPSLKRVTQWLDVGNSKGLVHLSFQLAEEPEEGIYRIMFNNGKDEETSAAFEVKEYGLPRFKVTVEPPEYILTTHSSFTFTACAKYSFGNPVKGTIHWEVSNLKKSRCQSIFTKNDKISGCSEINVKSSDLQMNECNVDTISAKATVTEEGVGEIEAGTSEVSVDQNAVIFETLYQDGFMKPNLPFTLKVLAKLPDGSPASGEPLEICHGELCRNITTPLDGIVKLYLTNANSQKVVMKRVVSRALLNERRFVHTSRRFYSPSNSSLVIQAPEETLNCTSGEEISLTLTVLSAAVQQKSAVINVQVMSRGKMQYFKSEEYELTYSKLPFEEEYFMDYLPLAPADTVTGFLNIPVILPFTASPHIKVLVWYIRDDGEVVSDVREMTVKKCLPNKVDFAWSTNTTQLGVTTSLTITSAPGSVCSYGVVGKSVESVSTRLDTDTLDRIFLDDSTYEINPSTHKQASDYSYCKTFLETNLREERGYEYATYYVDTLHMFDQTGLYIFTDLTLETRPCIRQAADDYYLRGGLGSPSRSREENFHETWLWDLVGLSSAGTCKQDVNVPHTINKWVGTAVCVHPQIGVGVSKSSSFTTYTSFYIDMVLPFSIQRGEVLPVKISVFNYLQQSLPVRVTLEGSTEYELIEENDASLPAGQRLSCIGPRDNHVHTVKIRPGTIGEVNITVRALVDTENSLPCGDKSLNIDEKYTLMRPLRVKGEGFIREETWSRYVCAKAEGHESLERAELIIPSGTVKGSERAWITVVGEQLTIPLKNLHYLAETPHGSGEDNTNKFALNVFIFEYLQATKQETPEEKERLLNFMRTGYQRQLLYKRLDGSFSAFGNADDSGSTSLTAFVLKIFTQAKEFISIDEGYMNATISWLINNYGNETCAQSIGEIYNAGDLGPGESSSIPVTANILISLLESGVSASDLTVRKAVRCLVQDQSVDSYMMALKAYALAIAGVPEAIGVLEKLLKQARVTDTWIYWNLPISYFSYGVGYYAYKAETAGCAILAMMTIDPSTYEQEVRKVVRWLSPQSEIYFSETIQHTIVAIQALVIYESTQYQGDLNVNITVEAYDFHHLFSVTESNKLVHQRVSLPILPINVSYRMEGQGCTVLQTVLHYNYPEPEGSELLSL